MASRAISSLAGSLICVALFASVACNNRGIQHRIEVQVDATVEQKIARAKSVATQARLDRLKEQLKERFPSLTDAQLNDHLGLRWDVLYFKSLTGKGSSTTVFVSVIGTYGDGFDPQPVVDAAVKLLEPEINGAAERDLGN